MLFHAFCEFLEADIQKLASLNVEGHDGTRIIVGLQQEKIQGASSERFLAEVKTEGDINSSRQKRTELLRLAAKAVHYPGLTGLVFTMKAQYVVQGLHTVDEEWFAKRLAELNLTAEGLQLQAEGRLAEAVQAALADS